MNEKSKTNYEKMARNIRFKTLFFKAVLGQEYIIEAIQSTSKNKPWANERSKKYRIKHYEEDNNIIFGDLQQIIPPNAEKVIIEREEVVDDNIDFGDNEFWGYNNCFIYDKTTCILALQHNMNGCGIKSFQAMLNSNLPDILNMTIDFAICPATFSFDDVRNASKLCMSFNVAKYQDFNEESFNQFKNIGKNLGAEEVKIILGTTKYLDMPIINQMVDVLNNDKASDFVDKFILDCQLSSGENAELNLLHNKAQKVEEIPYGIELDYPYRKSIIQNHFESFCTSL